MGILEGKMIEHLYMLVDNNGNHYFETERPTPLGECPKIEEIKTTCYSVGQVGYINNKMGLHVVRTGELYDGVTLHMYAPPITKVKIFEPARGKVTVRLPGFYSINSQLVSPIHRLIHDLLYEFSYSKWNGVNRCKFAHQVEILISDYCKANPTDWKSYAHYNDLVYAPNLVTRNEQFEVLIVCWRAGQSGRISSFGDSISWSGVLHGQLIQHVYQLLSESDTKYTEIEKPTPVGAWCPNLSDNETRVLDVGQTTFIHDSRGLQSLRAGELHDCVMIQVNSPPIKEVKVFEPARGRVSIRTPHYYSLESK
jgi:cysteine dioxygenase